MMDVDAAATARAPGEKAGQRRKRAPSSVATAAPDKEGEYLASRTHPSILFGIHLLPLIVEGTEAVQNAAEPAKKKHKNNKSVKLRPKAPTAPVARASPAVAPPPPSPAPSKGKSILS